MDNFKKQTSYLTVFVTDDCRECVFAFFNVFISVTHLDFAIEDDFRHPSLFPEGLSSTCFSFICLCLLDGGLNQPCTFTLAVYFIEFLSVGFDDTADTIFAFDVELTQF